MQEVEPIAVNFQQEEDVVADETFYGTNAGIVFAQQHIINKMNLFMEEYRRNGYSEEFISGFVDGINEVTGGTIRLSGGDEVDEELDNLADSD